MMVFNKRTGEFENVSILEAIFRKVKEKFESPETQQFVNEVKDKVENFDLEQTMRAAKEKVRNFNLEGKVNDLKKKAEGPEVKKFFSNLKEQFNTFMKRLSDWFDSLDKKFK